MYSEILERLKQELIISVHQLSGEEIYLLEKLVSLKLASKITTRINTFYCYGIINQG